MGSFINQKFNYYNKLINVLKKFIKKLKIFNIFIGKFNKIVYYIIVSSILILGEKIGGRLYDIFKGYYKESN